MARIVIDGISMQFGPRQVLRDLHLEIADGEFITLVGLSGCGKTTLLNLVAGLLAPTSGNFCRWRCRPWTGAFARCGVSGCGIAPVADGTAQC